MKLRVAAIRAVMDRRILINYRVDPLILGRLVPPPLRVKRVHCWGVAGVCLIRLRHARPRGLPAALGFESENAAIRIAVEWDEAGQTREGVYIPVRYTNSRLNASAGGRLFPGPQSLARFAVHETAGLHKIEMRTPDPGHELKVLCREADDWPAHSLFANLEEVSGFFRRAGRGYSPAGTPSRLEGVQLRPASWNITPARVEHLDAPYFTDPERFPPGSIQFDSALLMRNIDHEWRRLPTLRVGALTAPERRLSGSRRHAAFLELP